MKDRDNSITLNFMKTQTQTSLVSQYIESIYMHTICYKGVKYPKIPVTISQLTLIGLNNFTYYLKSTNIHLIHQERPIVSGSGGPTEKNSQLVGHFIWPLVPLLQSYIRD